MAENRKNSGSQTTRFRYLALRASQGILKCKEFAIAVLELVECHPLRFGVRLFQVLLAATLLIGVIWMMQSGLTVPASEGDAWEIKESERRGMKVIRNRSAETAMRAVRGRNLFRTLRSEAPAPVAVKPAAPASPPVPVKTIAEVAEDLTLVGVLQSDPPQAIVVNKKSQKTYYLCVGQALGEIRVIRVQRDRVVLGFNDETLELAL